MLGAKGEALQQLAAECTSRRLCVRLGPIDARHSWPVMATKCIFSVQTLYDDTSVEEGAANEPEGGRKGAWLLPYISVGRWIRLEARRTGSRS